MHRTFTHALGIGTLVLAGGAFAASHGDGSMAEDGAHIALLARDEAALEAVASSAPPTPYRDIHGTRLEALWLEARTLEALGRSPARALDRTTRWLEKLTTSFDDREHAELFRSATPLRRSIASGDLAARW